VGLPRVLIPKSMKERDGERGDARYGDAILPMCNKVICSRQIQRLRRCTGLVDIGDRNGDKNEGDHP
jgi:hypothetical protein